MVNLASMDIQGALKMDELRKQVRVITPEFQEWREVNTKRFVLMPRLHGGDDEICRNEPC